MVDAWYYQKRRGADKQTRVLAAFEMSSVPISDRTPKSCVHKSNFRQCLPLTPILFQYLINSYNCSPNSLNSWVVAISQVVSIALLWNADKKNVTFSSSKLVVSSAIFLSWVRLLHFATSFFSITMTLSTGFARNDRCCPTSTKEIQVELIYNIWHT